MAPTLTTAVIAVDVFANESHKMRSSNDIDQNKMTTLEVRIRANKGVELFDLIQAMEMCLILNVVVPKKFCVPEFIKYIGTQCSITHLKSYCNKITEVIHDEKLLMHFFFRVV